MTPDEEEQIRKALTAAEPTLERHEELVACAERRVRRASERLERAKTELAEAAEALVTAREARADWIANSPDPQMMMF